MDHPKTVGDRSTLAIMLALQSIGCVVSVPFGDNARYDLVIDEGSRLARVQCKTGRLRLGAVEFSTASSYVHLPSPRDSHRTYQGEIDYFAVYCPHTAGVYLIPIDDVAARRRARLRIDSPRNCQKKRIRLASRYEVFTVRIGEVAPGQLPIAS
jgi:hypothetical protein